MDITSTAGILMTAGYLTNGTPVTICDTCSALVRVEDIEHHTEWHSHGGTR